MPPAGNIATNSSDPTALRNVATTPESRVPSIASPLLKTSITSPSPLPEVQRKYSIDAAGRKASAANGTYFAALTHQKRGLGDPLAAQRRQSFNDQRREVGWIGGLWNNWVRGGGMGSGNGWGSKNMTGIKGGATANSVHYNKRNNH